MLSNMAKCTHMHIFEDVLCQLYDNETPYLKILHSYVFFNEVPDAFQYWYWARLFQ